MKSVTIIEEDLPMQVDCIHSNAKYSVIALGAYQLQIDSSLDPVPSPLDVVDPSEPPQQVRIGRIYLLKLDSSVPGGFVMSEELHYPAGVLDLKWEPIDEELLAVATATSLSFYNVQRASIIPNPPCDDKGKAIQISYSEDKITIALLCEVKLSEKTMALFLQWIDKERVIFSDSDGCVSICHIEEELGIAEVKEKVKLHESLTWVVHYTPEHDIVYSGDDAGVLTCFPLHQMSSTQNHSIKRFEMGITSIITKNEMVAVGSYDDTLKIYSLTSTDPKVTLVLKFEINLGGAVWRTQWLPNLSSDAIGDHYMAVACARNGFKLLKINETIEVVHDYKKYEGALAYGLHVEIDWKSPKYVFHTCYFDNHVVHVFDLAH